MNRIKQFILSGMFMLVSLSLVAQQVEPLNVNLPVPSKTKDLKEGKAIRNHYQQNQRGGLPFCGVDTVQYPIFKATGLAALLLNNVTSATALTQYYPAPDTIVLSGFSFFAWSTSGVTVTVDCRVYAAGPDSLPMGAPLASTTVMVDTTFGSGLLSQLQKVAVFTNPVTVTGPYILVVENNSANNIALVTSDWDSSDGRQEWLAGALIGISWLRGYQVSVGGVPFDADVLLHPHISTNPESGFLASPFNCIQPGTTVNFMNASSGLYSSKFYSLAAFLGLEFLQYEWDFGDGSPTVNAVDTSHTYSAGGLFLVVKVDTLFGWTVTCINGSAMIIGSAVAAGFSYTTNNLEVTFTDTSFGFPGNPTSFFWDFGDGNTSTAQNPVHTYALPGTYTVCQIVSDSCSSDTMCTVLSVSGGCPTITGLNVTRIKPQSARLNWTPSPDAMAYQIRGRSSTSSFWKYILVSNPSATYKDVFGLVYNRTYYWQIRQFCTNGDTSAWSVLDTFMTQCQRPDSVWTDPITPTSARFNWVISPGSVGYEIRAKRLGGNWINIPVGGGTTSFKDFNNVLTPNTTYVWKVRSWCSVNGAAISAYSVTDTFTTPSSLVRLAGPDIFDEASSIQVMPHPVQDRATITFDNPLNEEMTLVIREISGKEVKRFENMTSNFVEFTREDLASGLYLIEVAGNTTQRGKIVLE